MSNYGHPTIKNDKDMIEYISHLETLVKDLRESIEKFNRVSHEELNPTENPYEESNEKYFLGRIATEINSIEGEIDTYKRFIHK